MDRMTTFVTLPVQLMAFLPGNPESRTAELEKGTQQQTFNHIRAELRTSVGVYRTAEQIAADTGLSKMTVRRYLNDLIGTGESRKPGGLFHRKQTAGRISKPIKQTPGNGRKAHKKELSHEKEATPFGVRNTHGFHNMNYIGR